MIPGSREGLRYELASGLLARSQRLLKGAGAKGREAYVVWVGEMEGSKAKALDVWPLAAEATAVHARIPFREVLAISDLLAQRSWFVLAQLHSHPGVAFHSETDNRFPISNQLGFISIVVPNSAGDEAGAGWAWFEFIGEGAWRHLGVAEIRARFLEKGMNMWQRIWNGITARPYS